MPSETQPQEDDKGSEQVGRAVVPCLSPDQCFPSNAVSESIRRQLEGQRASSPCLFITSAITSNWFPQTQGQSKTIQVQQGVRNQPSKARDRPPAKLRSLQNPKRKCQGKPWPAVETVRTCASLLVSCKPSHPTSGLKYSEKQFSSNSF